MHERTERAVARLLFVFCCAVPTAIVLATILLTWTPWYHRSDLRAEAAKLSVQTSLAVKIADFARVSPLEIKLQRVEFTDPETDQPVAFVRQVTWASSDEGDAVVLHQPKLQSAQLGHVWNLIHERFLCRPEHTAVPINFSANDLIIESESGSLTLKNVFASMEPLPKSKSVKTTVQCEQATAEPGEPLRITIVRDRNDVPRTRCSLESGATPLPCSALAEYFPFIKKLGPKAEFVGNLTWEIDRIGNWTLDLGNARFTGIDLGLLFADMPERFSGTADLVLDRCLIKSNDKPNVSGFLQAQDGWMSRGRLRSLQNELQFPWVDPRAIEESPSDIHYKLMAFEFDLTNSKLQIAGACNNYQFYQDLPPGVLLVGDGPIAQSSQAALAPVQLAYALAPQNSELVPISQQTMAVLQWLVPRKPAVVNESGLPRTRVAPAVFYSDGEPVREP